MPIRGGGIIAFTSWAQLVIMNAVNEILSCYCLMVFWDGDRPGNGKHILDEGRSDGNYTLYGYFATLAHVV